MDEQQRFEAGDRVRREVLGDAHVDRSHAASTEFDKEFQELMTRYAWGEMWTRPGLPRATRSILTVGLLVALGRTDELRLHLRGAINNGVSREEIREILLHCAAYCGVPAANTGFRVAKELLNELDEQKKS
jgi:4-carboxymuconolactone decarboxylase